MPPRALPLRVTPLEIIPASPAPAPVPVAVPVPMAAAFRCALLLFAASDLQIGAMARERAIAMAGARAVGGEAESGAVPGARVDQRGGTLNTVSITVPSTHLMIATGVSMSRSGLAGLPQSLIALS